VYQKILIQLQVIFTIFFIIVLVLTYTHSEDIKKNARIQIVDKVIELIEPKIKLAEKTVNSKGTQKFLNNSQVKIAKSEIFSYRRDPINYVTQIMQSKNIPNGKDNTLLKKIFDWQLTIQKYINDSFSNLLKDIRIFCTTNIIALYRLVG